MIVTILAMGRKSFRSLVRETSPAKSNIIIWLNKPKWLNRLTLYFLILLPMVYIILKSIFSYFGLVHTDVDSARYMLSAMVQGEGAIVAIVVTLSLVAVQLAASSYSARVIDIFRRTPDLWILIAIYSFSIFYSLAVLKTIESANPQLSYPMNRWSNLEAHISFAYYFGFFAFMALVPYIWSTLEMLKPSTVINMLAERITKQNILSSIEKTSDDPVMPVIDIVNGALLRYDYETVIDGLTAIGEHTSSIFKKLGNTHSMLKRLGHGTYEEMKISEIVFDHLTSVGKLAASKNNEKATVAALFSLWTNVEIAAEQRFEVATKWGIESIEEVGIAGAERRLEMATLTAVQLIGTVGETIARQSKEENMAKQKLENIVITAVNALKEIRRVAMERRLNNPAQEAEDSIKRIHEATNPSSSL